MTSTNPRMNGKTLRMHIAEGTAEISRGDAIKMKIACDKWLRERDPGYIPSSGFHFGSLVRRTQPTPIAPITPATA